jgi:signal transduction histidine kinase
MVGPMHPFFHNWYGFSILLVPMAVAVWLFSKAVFGAFGRMQEEIEQLHQEAQVQVVERERQHIAREMHDGLAQVLSFVNTKAQAAEEFLRNGDPDTAREHIAELSEAARKVYADIREGIVALRVDVSGGRSVREIVHDYVQEFEHFSRLRVHVTWGASGDELDLPPVVEVQALRIVQEALANVRRHAHASEAWVTVASAGDALEVCVRDNGQGFDPEHIARGQWPQFGLRSMRERAEAAGGSLEIESELGNGTLIRATFPRVLRTAVKTAS